MSSTDCSIWADATRWPSASDAGVSTGVSQNGHTCHNASSGALQFIHDCLSFVVQTGQTRNEASTSAPTLALVVEGEGAIATLRTTIGATNPADAAPGTIRGDLALAMPNNLVHGSDSPESAAREIALWFGDDELV